MAEESKKDQVPGPPNIAQPAKAETAPLNKEAFVKAVAGAIATPPSEQKIQDKPETQDGAEQKKKQTSRIPLQSAPETQDGAEQKIQDKPETQDGAEQEIQDKPETQDGAEQKKKQTSRISLEQISQPSQKTVSIKKSTSSISGMSAESGVPATIRLKRPATPLTQNAYDTKVEEPGADATPSSEAPTVAKKPPIKGQTSRIVLPEAPDASRLQQRQMKQPAVTVPKTIRIKRPSTGVAEAETTIAPVDRERFETAKKSETAKIDMIGDAEASAPLTQRKTIKIKRSERKVVPRTKTMMRPGAAAAKDEKPEQEEEAAADDVGTDEDIGTFFIVAAAAAMLVTCAVAYLMAAQLMPDLGLPLPESLVF